MAKKIKSKKDSEELNNEDTSQKINKKNNKKYFIIFAVCVIVAILYFLRGYFVVAVVNNKPITRISIIKNLENKYGSNELENRILQEVIYQEAEQRQITIADDLVNKEIDKIKDLLSQQGTTFEAALEAEGMNEKDLRDNIKLQKITEELLKDKISVTDEEISNYYQDNKDFYGEESTLDDVKDQITQLLANQKFQTNFESLITELKEKHKIRYFFNY